MFFLTVFALFPPALYFRESYGMMKIIVCAILIISTGAFIADRSTMKVPNTLSMGLFDDLKVIFSDEGKKNRKEYDERERDEQVRAQKEILERRRNPKIMSEYEQKIQQNRQKLAEERDVYKFQQKVQDGYDPLIDWKRLRKEGKIKIGTDLERDKGSERLGSEGLIDVRVDERMPYIDQGYVDESSDVIGNVSQSVWLTKYI